MNIFSHKPLSIIECKNVPYYLFDQNASSNPFTKNEYDFDSNFYNGTFKFESPLTRKTLVDTPEAYGRHRIAAYVHESTSRARKGTITILDIGAGSADLARILPLEDRPKITMVNSDISGPETDLGELSLLVRGMDRLGPDHDYNKVVNVQYDLNESEWPFAENTFDYICSNMALHHIKGDKKSLIAEKIFASLIQGGKLIINDVFDFNLDRVMFTREGKKGPIECTGYVESLKSTLDRLLAIGFTLSNLSLRVAKSEFSYTEKDLNDALADRSEIMPISKAVWYIVAIKP